MQGWQFEYWAEERWAKDITFVNATLHVTAGTNNCVIATILPPALATQATATANSFAASVAATTTTTTTITSVTTSTSATTTSSAATTTSIRAVPIALGTFSSL